MKALSKLIFGFTLAAASSCKNPAAPVFDNVTLTAGQTTTLLARAQTMSTVHTELAWLADTVEAILKAGTVAYNVPITVDGQVKRYFAVSLVRQIIGATTATSTLHFIAFDNATNPADFILVNAYAQIPGDTPIGDIAANLGAPTMFAHRVLIAGTTVTDYVGKAGTVDFSVKYGSAGCGAAVGVTCRDAFLDTEFNITQARPDAAVTDVHTFSVSGLTIPGVWLLFN